MYPLSLTSVYLSSICHQLHIHLPSIHLSNSVFYYYHLLTYLPVLTDLEVVFIGNHFSQGTLAATVPHIQGAHKPWQRVPDAPVCATSESRQEPRLARQVFSRMTDPPSLPSLMWEGPWLWNVTNLYQGSYKSLDFNYPRGRAADKPLNLSWADLLSVTCQHKSTFEGLSTS